MTQAQDTTFEDLSPKEVAEKIHAEGGQSGLVFASMVIAIRAMYVTKDKDDNLGCDIAKNLFAFLKTASLESFLGGLCKKAAEDDEFRASIEESPMLAIAIMGKQVAEEKRKYMDVMNNLVHAAFDLDKPTS